MARRLIDFKGLEKKIQRHADNNNEGNFSRSVRDIISCVLDREEENKQQLAESKSK